MRDQRNFLIGLLVLAVGAVLIGQALGVLPAGLNDLLLRALPAVLIALGLGAVLRGRVPFASIIALALTAFIVVNVALVAFSGRAAQQRTDQTVVVSEAVGPNVTLVSLEIALLSSDLDLVADASGQRTVSGQFVGSTESAVDVTYADDGTGRAVLRITESQPNPFPDLEDVGRGKLALTLPTGVALDVAVHVQQGAATLNLDLLDLERLNLDVVRGDAIVNLPDYQPRSPSVTADPTAPMGTLTAADGGITVAVPSGVGARFELNRAGSGIDPQYDATLYNYLVGDVLESRNFDRAATQLRYVVSARGAIRITEIAR
ncbi:MAG: hypothetical protein DWB44_03750 [Chloroflexi bacterium]|nr:hypothetical protein [Chloroflexota bacterium]MDL1916286.1 hypothetical protein [Anaerolineae bacterium CFX4]OQY85968.1 MAG: hypothetical protein B6D42_02305 [Anaerolineae bacterium UTCFX5]GIK29511.1 MAG: hypothetical protein BroJett007_26490 [Chloroflexota bacterium]